MTQPAALTLSIGVTGHRLNKLGGAEVDRLKGEVRQVFAALRHGIADTPGGADGVTRKPPTLQVVSPLAEGADRIVAETALEQDAELIALLPFAREDYVQDFESPASRAEFAALLERATDIVELSGPSQTERDRQAAYAKVGAMVVKRSDVLIALWDGEEADGTGGTAQIVRLAEKGRRPVFWLPTAGNSRGRPKAPRLLLAGKVTRAEAADAFVAVARSIVAKQCNAGDVKPSARGT
jgi:hypothetical protein